MAREVIIRMSDDFDRGLEADEIIEFTYEGVAYTLDLTTEHAEEFRAALKPYMEAAHEAVKLTKAGVPTKAGGSKPGRLKKASVRSPDDETAATRQKIREWATANGHTVRDRGIIPQTIRDAYSEATGIPVRANVSVRADEVTMDQLELIQSEGREPAHIREAREVQAKLSATDDEKFAASVEEIKKKRRPPNVTSGEGNYHGITPEMRDWARANGHEVTAKGYIPKHVRELFEAEQAASRNGVHA